MLGNIVKDIVIVQFIVRGRQPEVKCIDIVPKSWIFVNEMNMMKCYYPREFMHKVEQLVRGLVEPDIEAWENYTVKCLYNAGTYRRFVKNENIYNIKN